LKKTPFGRAPSEAGAGGVDEALPKELLVSYTKASAKPLLQGLLHAISQPTIYVKPRSSVSLQLQAAAYQRHRLHSSAASRANGVTKEASTNK
jgi:hypothetical protein